MLTGAIVLAGWLAADTGCATPAICDLVARARAANGRAGGQAYEAVAEAEVTGLAVRSDFVMEGATSIEQYASRIRWDPASGVEQVVVGYRSRTAQIPILATGQFTRIGWLVPTLAGERLVMLRREGAEPDDAAALAGLVATVHPLARDAAPRYRYVALDTLAAEGDRPARLRLRVAPVPPAEGEAILLDGDLELDAASLAVVRVRARVVRTGRPVRPARLVERLAKIPTVMLVDLRASRVDGTWIPLEQRFEVETVSGLVAGEGVALRVLTRLDGVRVGPASVPTATPAYTLTWPPRGTIARHRDWHHALGGDLAGSHVADLADLRPPAWQPTGAPRLRPQGRWTGDFVRLNRVEGLFLGPAATLWLRDWLPGGRIEASAGYAFTEQEVRGGAGLAWLRDGWRLDGGWRRALDVTNDFRNQLDDPAFAMLLSRDNWDYVDRRGPAAGAQRYLGPGRGSFVRVDGAWLDDGNVVASVEKTPIVGYLRNNRPADPGQYWRARATLDLNPDVGGRFVARGLGLRAEYEGAFGDLDWQRAEVRVVGRTDVGPLMLLARAHAGVLLGEAPPTQSLFEFGGAAALPGFEYKEFAGDRAALLRARVGWSLPFLDRPVTVGHVLVLPSLAPSVSLGYQSGWTAIVGAGTQAAIDRLGPRFDTETGAFAVDSTGALIPASVATDGLRHSVDLRIGFFNNNLAIGVARALEGGRGFQVFFATGGQF